MLIAYILFFTHAHDLTCEREMNPGAIIMGLPVLLSEKHHVTFKNKSCNDTYAYDETLTIITDKEVYGEWIIQVDGAVLHDSTCGGRRIVNQKEARVADEARDDHISVYVAYAQRCYSPECTVIVSPPCILHLNRSTIPADTIRTAVPDYYISQEGPLSLRKIMIHVHMYSMLTGWCCLAPLAVLSSVFKQRVGGSWLKLHTRLVFAVFLCTYIGLACMIGVKTYHFTSIHDRIGLVAVVLIHIQATNGLWRLSKTHKMRRYWEICHKLMGYAQLIVVAFCIGTGIIATEPYF